MRGEAAPHADVCTFICSRGGGAAVRRWRAARAPGVWGPRRVHLPMPKMAPGDTAPCPAPLPQTGCGTMADVRYRRKSSSPGQYLLGVRGSVGRCDCIGRATEGGSSELKHLKYCSALNLDTMQDESVKLLIKIDSERKSDT